MLVFVAAPKANAQPQNLRSYFAVVKRMKIQRLRWLGHVLRMESSNPVRKVFESEPDGGCRRQGRPPQRWAKQADENLRTLQQPVTYGAAN